MCQGFSYFSVFLHHFILTKLASSSKRVKQAKFIVTCFFFFSPVDQCGPQGLGVRSVLPAGRELPAERLSRRLPQDVEHRQLSACGRDQGPREPHQCRHHKLILHLHSIKVSATRKQPALLGGGGGGGGGIQ